MSVFDLYREAKNHVLRQGYAEELCWQAKLRPELTTETDFLREAAWVIYCSGFREATVRKYFDYLSLCFCDWESSSIIATMGQRCVDAAMLGFRAKKKHEAIVAIAARIASVGFEAFYSKILDAPLENLQQLPFIGPVTALHLAKNLGFSVAKPDRHLLRFSRKHGYETVHTMCLELSALSGDTVQVVDLVLWRYLERLSVSRVWAPELSV